jgi:hypothetical protein
VPQTFPDIQHAPGTPPMDAGHPLHSRTTWRSGGTVRSLSQPGFSIRE